MNRLKTFENFENLDNFNELDIVISTENIGDIPIGTKGTIVHIYPYIFNFNYMAYAVEFFDDDHNTLSVETATKKQIKKDE